MFAKMKVFIFGLFLLAVGLAWNYAIYQRGQIFLPDSEKAYFQTAWDKLLHYQWIKKDLDAITRKGAIPKDYCPVVTAASKKKQSSKESDEEDDVEPFDVWGYIQNKVFCAFSTHEEFYVLMAWGIAILEVLCALLYLCAGLVTVIFSGNSYRWIYRALIFNMILLILVAAYHFFIAIPLQEILESKNILFTYFVPNHSWFSVFSGMVSGAMVTQRYGLLYLIGYGIYYGVCFSLVDKPDFKQSLRQKKSKSIGV